MKPSNKVWSILKHSARRTSVFGAMAFACWLLEPSLAQELSPNTSGVANVTATIPVIATIPVGKLPLSLVVSPDSKFVYVADLTGISVIDTATNKVTSTISVSGPTGLAITPDGSTLYCAESSINAE